MTSTVHLPPHTTLDFQPCNREVWNRALRRDTSNGNGHWLQVFALEHNHVYNMDETGIRLGNSGGVSGAVEGSAK